MENTAMEPNEYLHALRHAMQPPYLGSSFGQSGEADDPLIDDDEIERLQRHGSNDRSESDVRIEHARKLIEEGESRQYVAEMLNVGRVTLYRALCSS